MRDSIRRTLALVGLVFVLVLHAPAARADELGIDQLAKTMSSSSEKARLSAVVSLARLEDRRALKPLVAGLRDPSPRVRAVAAAGLGKLKHRAAFAALKNAWTDDSDETVRSTARAAMIMVAQANDMMDAVPPDPNAAPVARSSRRVRGFGHSPHAVDARPDLYVLVKSSSDDSPGNADKATRKSDAEIVKQALVDSFRSAPQVTLAQGEAQRWGLDPRAIDLSVTKLDVASVGGTIEIDAELRLAISDESGKMLSFVSGGAKVQVPAAKFNARFLPTFRKEALEGALRGLFDKLLDHLRQTTQS